MSAAKIAAALIEAYCSARFPKYDSARGSTMGSTVLTGNFLHVFDFQSAGSYLYIPADRLNDDLDLPHDDGGVFWYVKMHDGSYLLKTCDGPLAVWSGSMDDKAEFVK